MFLCKFIVSYLDTFVVICLTRATLTTVRTTNIDEGKCLKKKEEVCGFSLSVGWKSEVSYSCVSPDGPIL